ncbi:MAG: YHS domain-containing protein [Candidatus Bathyarchaeota archaeon]|nr:YHS domain-containing protein [Candidatus Bathyarchaeota archaeon]
MKLSITELKRERKITKNEIQGHALYIKKLFEKRGIEMAKDPVCGMYVDESESDLKIDYNEKTYYFCNVACKQSFEKNPKDYIE